MADRQSSQPPAQAQPPRAQTQSPRTQAQQPQSQRRSESRARSAGRPEAAADPRAVADAVGAPGATRKTGTQGAPAVKIEEEVVTEGASGARNLSIQWIDVWIGNAKPCRFDVSTLPGNGLEVTIEQLSYKKTYTGTGSLSTQPVPVVPVGTTFRIVSKDTTTGEAVEQRGKWVDMGGGMSLWSLIKQLLWKGS